MNQFSRVLVLFFILDVMALFSHSLSAETTDPRDIRPATAIRWEVGFPDPDYKTPDTKVCDIDIQIDDVGEFDVDGYGRLYLMDPARQKLYRFSSDGKLECSWDLESSFDVEQWISRPRNICVTPCGIIWMGPIVQEEKSNDGRNIRVYNTFVRKINPASNEDIIIPIDGHVGEQLASATDDGFFLYESYQHSLGNEYKPGPRIYSYSSDGKLKASWTTPRLSSISTDTNGLVYGVVEGGDRVLVFDSAGQSIREIDISKSIAPIRGYPSRVSPDINGDIYFETTSNYRLNSNGDLIARWQYFRSPEIIQAGGCFEITDQTLKNGLYYTVYRSENSRTGQSHREIIAYTPDGQCVLRYRTKPLSLDLPCGVTFLTDGSYLVHGGKYNVLYDSQGNKTGGLVLSDLGNKENGAQAPGPDGSIILNTLQQVEIRNTKSFRIASASLDVVDKKGKVQERFYTTELNNLLYPEINDMKLNPATGDLWAINKEGDLFQFDKNRKLIKTIKNKGGIKRQYYGNMAVDPKGYIYATSEYYNSLYRLDFDGNMVAEIAKKGSGLGEFKTPRRIAIDPLGRVYVADVNNNRIQVFSSDLKPLGYWGTYGSGEGQLDHPMGVTFAPDGKMWICDTLNDRILKMSLDEFWRGVRQDIQPVQVVNVLKHDPEPAAGNTTVSGIVIAGTEDFEDYAYIESPNRAWAVQVKVPQGKKMVRGQKYKVKGALSIDKHFGKSITADQVETIANDSEEIEPLGMANLYIGNGYQNSENRRGLSNICLLARTWGKVVEINEAKNYFVINDGSFTVKNGGIPVFYNKLRRPLTNLPRVGQYVGVTGISIAYPGNNGAYNSGIHIRDENDINVLAEN